MIERTYIQATSLKKAILELYQEVGSGRRVQLVGFSLGEFPGDEVEFVFDVLDESEEL